MGIKIAINGFGRIGRIMLRAAFEYPQLYKGIEFVAINDVADPKVLAHLLKYDSVHGVFKADVTATDKSISVNGTEIPVMLNKSLDDLIGAWKNLEMDYLVESTGIYKKRPQLERLANETQAKQVLLSRPMGDADLTVVMGVNDNMLNPATQKIISNASCTTNCIAPAVHVLNKEFGVVRGMMTTIHSYTNDQVIHDKPHSDMRRARAGALSMIPTTTGAARAIGLVIPELKGKFDGGSVRVPTPDVSLVDCVAELKKDVSIADINAAMKSYAEGPLKGILRYEETPLVSVDYIHDPHSSTYDADASTVLGGTGNLAKVILWYDNEMGYSCRMLDLALALKARS